MDGRDVELPAELVAELQQLLGARLLLDPGERWAYGYDNSRLHQQPAAVVLAETASEVQQVVALCHKRRVPLVARGRGTATTGAAVPFAGGVVLSTEGMDQILELDADNRLMRVQPGVTNQAVQTAAAESGFFWPPDPTSAAVCSVGGNLACNAAGPRAVKYGSCRENTLGLKAVTGDGRELACGVNTTKGVVGYDFTRLIIGSEGTLAVITEATLKLTPLPGSRRGVRVLYDGISSAARAIARIMAQAVTPSILEFIDDASIDLIRRHASVELDPAARSMLLLELDGSASSMDAGLDALRRACGVSGLVEFAVADESGGTEKLWAARKALSPALRSLAPKKINEDVVVPVSRLPELINGLRELSSRYGIAIVNFGHAGNGNIHTNLLIDPDDPRQQENTSACLDAVFELVLRLGGTLSGEHGIGYVKREYVGRELGEVNLSLMRSVKAQFDPHGILNPEKMIPGGV